MFEDVFEPLDDIVGTPDEAGDEWGEIWDTGEKEDIWRSSPAAGVWSVEPTSNTEKETVPENIDPTDEKVSVVEPEEKFPEAEAEEPPDDQPESRGSGLFDDLFLDIF